MNIEVHQPRLEALIEQRMASGRFQSIEDALVQALEAAPLPPEPTQADRQNLADFLMQSPLRGSGLKGSLHQTSKIVR